MVELPEAGARNFRFSIAKSRPPVGRRIRGFCPTPRVAVAEVAGMDGIGFAIETANGAFHAPPSPHICRIKMPARLHSKGSETASPLSSLVQQPVKG